MEENIRKHLYADGRIQGGIDMIYITGDCHGEYSRFGTQKFPEQKMMSKEDYVIICGDFGYWDNSMEQKYWRKWLEKKPFTTLWIDGNHENYDLLMELPVTSWKGGYVQMISPSVIHLMRGQVYQIDGIRIFCFGGASSHDICGGILETNDPDLKQKKKQLDKCQISYRINHVSWWKEELPSDEEYKTGRSNLDAAGHEVDYVVSHCAPTGIQNTFGAGLMKPDHLTDYLESIRQSTGFAKWYFGHYHDNRSIQERYMMLYDHIVRIL